MAGGRSVRVIKRAVVACGLAILAGCGGNGVSPTPDVRPLAEVELADPTLRACLLATAESRNYQTVADVRELSCTCGAPCQQHIIDDYLRPLQSAAVAPRLITDTTGIEQFTELRKLDLGMHLIDRIDVSELVHLQHLGLAGARVTELDLSRNTALRSLDIRAAGLINLDLSGLNNLEQIRATAFSAQPRVYLDGFLEVVWPPADGSREDFARHHLRSLTVNPDAPLVALHVDARTEHNVQASASLLTYTGSVSEEMLHHSPKLVAVTGELPDAVTELDLSAHTALLYLHLTSASLTGFTPPVGLEQLILEAPLANLEPGANTALLSLELASPMEIFPNLAVGNEGAFSASLRHLTLKNYNLGRIFSVDAYTVLETLTLDHSYVDILLTIPDNLRELSVRGRTYFSLFSAAALEPLTLEAVPGQLCNMGDIQVPNTRELIIHDCAATAVGLEFYDKLERLRISNSALDTIDLSPLADVQSVVLTDNRLNTIDLSSFAGQQKTLLDLRGNEFDEAYKQDLRGVAEAIFERVEL